MKATGVCRECQQKVKPVGSGSKCEACREWQHVWPVGSGSKCKVCWEWQQKQSLSAVAATVKSVGSGSKSDSAPTSAKDGKVLRSSAKNYLEGRTFDP